ncbi:hypothetical protein, partial [Enterobacter bugandensis]
MHKKSRVARGKSKTATFGCALSLWAEESPQNNTSTDDPLSLEGEGWGEGEHTAEVVIPFTLCSLLLCKDMTCERARAAQSPPP